jgi:hypothetical protein
MNFTIATPPTSPALLSPEGNITDPHPPYRWAPSTDATSFTLAVYSNGSASYVFVTNVAASYCTGGVCTYHPTTTLANGTYRFKVLAKNAFGSSPYSDWLSFTVSP